MVASWGPHFGEEDCLVGRQRHHFGQGAGSGTIFFAGCNLGCLFCQNWDISHRAEGEPADAETLAEIMLKLQRLGCLNINLVTPSHVVPQILAGLALAVPAGLRLPIVYNTSAYDDVGTLRLLDGVVDIYMPDFKYWSAERAAAALTAADYPRRARRAIREMHRQVGDLSLDGEGIARRGLLVRHLAMPDCLDESAAVFDWLAALSPATFVNVMGQYRPAGPAARRPADLPYLSRPLRSDELAATLARARAAGLTRAGTW